MKVLNIGSNTIAYYQSTQELPIGLYSKFNGYLMQDSGMGSDFNSIGGHHEKLYTFHKLGNEEAFEQEYTNLQYNLIHILEGITIEHYAFACLIQSINEETNSDYSEAGLKRVIDKLHSTGLTQGQLNQTLEEVKKNWIPN